MYLKTFYCIYNMFIDYIDYLKKPKKIFKLNHG